jgi:hypothetical protein
MHHRSDESQHAEILKSDVSLVLGHGRFAKAQNDLDARTATYDILINQNNQH